MITSLALVVQIALMSDVPKVNATTLSAHTASKKKLNPIAENAFRRLVEGNARFAEGLNMHPHQGVESRLEAAKGQLPHTIVVTCADSRLSPELIFDQGIGDIFVIRVAGNVVDQFSIASIEYAAEHLHTPFLVVLGHERCGAVGAAVGAYEASLKSSPDKTEKSHDEHGAAGHDEHANISALVHEILPSVLEAALKPGQLLPNAIDINVERVIHKTMSRSPMLLRLAHESKFDVIGGTYDLDTGRVTFTAPKDFSTIQAKHK